MKTNNVESITIETIINQSIENTWIHWTTPEHIINWNFASDDWHSPKATNDLKIGGKFNYKMAAKDGSVEFDFEGYYTNVIIHEKIAYDIGGRNVYIEFIEIGNQTKIIETFDAENENSIELQRNGWQAILNNFKKYSETN
jgi:uncharacterized protein YndB with AHSA1/START domain